MSETFELVWGPAGGTEAPATERREVASRAELEDLLERLDAAGRDGKPFIAMLVHPKHGTLGIGLGSDRSIATFERADGEPPYLISRGQGNGGPDPVFYLEGEWSEFPADAAIPAAAARDAMVGFLETGSAPASLNWSET